MALNKYAFIFGKGGTGYMATADELTREKETNPQSKDAKLHWYEVPVVDAIIDGLNKDIGKAFDNGYESGLSDGRKQGQSKVDAWATVGGAQYTQEQLNDAAQEAYCAGAEAGQTAQKNIDAKLPQSDTRVNQVLNELYHDRARLEGVIKQFVRESSQFVDDVKKLLQAQATPRAKTKVLLHNVKISGTVIGTLTDAYGDKS